MILFILKRYSKMISRLSIYIIYIIIYISKFRNRKIILLIYIQKRLRRQVVKFFGAVKFDGSGAGATEQTRADQRKGNGTA